MVVEIVPERWGYSNNEVIQRIAHSGDKENEVEIYKILGWKDELNMLYVGWRIVKLTWIDCIKSKIYKFYDHDITISFFFRCELH